MQNRKPLLKLDVSIYQSSGGLSQLHQLSHRHFTCLEDLLQVRSKSVHDEEPILLAVDHVTTAAPKTRHAQ